MRLTGLIALIAVTLVSSADAHLMPAKQGTLNVVEDAVFGVLSVPVSALHGFDDDGDGLLEMEELQRHQEELRSEIDRRFVIMDGAVAGESVRVDLVLSPEHEAASDRAAHVVALKHARFPAPVRRLGVACDLFGREREQLTITATRPADKASETAVLTQASPRHRFFRSRWAAFFEDAHVDSGALLTILAVLAAAVGWRYRHHWNQGARA